MTPRLLDLLASAGATATFFPIAPRAETLPELVRRMLDEGHTVGLHCDEHIRHTERTEAWLEADTRRALGRLRDLGARPVRWRTPWGVTADWTKSVADALDLTLTGWTVDTHDWRGDGAPDMLAATRAQLTGGAIVLAHDGIGPGALRADAAETVAFAELAIDHARGTGLDVAAL